MMGGLSKLVEQQINLLKDWKSKPIYKPHPLKKENIAEELLIL